MQTNPQDAESSEPGRQRFGRAAGRGFSWMSLSLLLGKVFIFSAQIVLGWILTHEEFGVLMIVAGVAACIQIFHDGGVPQVIVQRGSDAFERLQGAAFWICLGVSLFAGVVLGAVAPVIAEYYDDERLVSLLRVLAITLPLAAPAAMLRAKLQIDLRFRTISFMAVGKFAVRSIGMIVLAWLGYGVMCFVIPLVFVAVFEFVFTFLATRATPWMHPPRFAHWPALVRDSYWVVCAAVFKGLARNGDYLVLGRMLPIALVGPYFFAYLWTTQITGLLALNLRHVLFPVMTKMVGDPARQASAIVRTIRLLILVAAPASMLIVVTIRPLESLIWHGKWVVAVPLMQIFALVSPILIFTDISHAALTALGRFRLSACLTLAEAIWLLASAWFAAVVAGNNIIGVAIWIIGLRIAYTLVVNALVLGTFGITVRQYLAAFLPQWLVALTAAGGTVLVGQFLPDDTASIAQVVVLALTFVAMFAVLARLLLGSQLEQFAKVAPGPVGVAVHRIFWLPPSAE